jgi:conjugal transfer pilus assembly protein TraF
MEANTMKTLTKRLRALMLAAASLLATVLPVHAQVSQTGQTAEDADTPPSYFKRGREGWFWYQDPPAPPKQTEPKPEPAPAPAPAPARAPAMTAQDRDIAAFKALQVEFDRALQAATANQSDENVARLLEIYALSRRKASALGEKAEALAVRMPWLDETFTGSRPTGPGAMRAFDSIRMQDRDQLIREMSQSWGLYFFFRSNCAYCHLQAPLLLQFAAKYGFTIMPVSLDGGTLPDFPNPARDTGLANAVADAIGVPMQHFVTPALILARPSTREVLPVGFGALNMDEIVQRIAMAVRQRDNGAGFAPPTLLAALTGAPIARPANDPPPSTARVMRFAAPATR